MIGPDNLLCVPRPQIELLWPAVAPLIDEAYAALDEITPDVRTWLIEGKGLLWVLAESSNIFAAATSSLVQARGGLACRVVACGGSQGDWQACLDKIERYATVEGCYKTVIDGRRGWERVLTGYRPMCVSFEKRM